MIVVAYTKSMEKPVQFDDQVNPEIWRKPLIDGLALLSEAFDLPSDSIWIVPGTEDK